MQILVFGFAVIGLFLLSSSNLLGASKSTTLQQADSLFKAAKYTESLKIYESLLEQGSYSNSMLLKMAFIREGLSDISGALYYLSLYYNKTSDRQVLGKMEEIAEEHQLVGFKSGDRDFFLRIYHKYEYFVLGLVGAVSFILLGMIWQQIRHQKRRPIGLGVVYVTALAALLLLMNYNPVADKGIIYDHDTYLMTGPSAGADVYDIIKKGHRVEILGREGVWIRIRWGDEEVYVRQNKIKVLG